MFTSFSTALSGLNAMSSAIDVVGNNLANLNTTGYKDQSVSFQDLVAASLTGSQSEQAGLGTTQPLTRAQFVQGSVQTTGGSYDAAINGAGFFIAKDSNGQDVYTRAGDFVVDKNGYLTTETGERVQGWTAEDGTVNPSGGLSDIQVPVGQALSATATTKISTTVNLDASTTAGDSWSTGALDVIDSMGNKVPLSVSFTKDTVNANTWDYTVTGTGATVTNGTGSLQFDSSGNLVSPSSANGSVSLALSGLSDSSANMNINWNLYDSSGTPSITQYSETSSLAAQSADGSPAAVLTGVSLETDGKITATYSNGAASQTAAQLALASIRNPQSLVDIGNNNFSLGADSAAPTVGASGMGGLGTIDGGKLESSTVDIATEFSNLLTFERSYQADSRVVTVSDELAQDAVNLVK